MLRQPDRQLLLRYWNGAIGGTVDDRKWRAPVALTADQPVAQAIRDHELANALFLQVPDDFVNSLVSRRTIEWARIDHDAQVLFGLCPCIGIAGLLIHRANDLAYRYAELARKLEVALVMSWDTHDGPGAVAHQHIVGNPDRNLFAVDRIGDVAPGKDTGLLLFRAHALDLGHMSCLVYVGIDLGLVFRRGDLLDPWMFRGQYKECHAVDCVRPRGEDRDLFTLAIDLREEANLSPFAAPDPVALHGHGLFRPVDLREVQQFFSIVGNFQQPLVDLFTDHHAATAFAGAVGQHLLVGQSRVAAWTPVSRGFGAIGQSLLVELQEQPLRPFIVVGHAGNDFALPIPLGTHQAQLLAHGVDVCQCPGACLNAM